jgi:hypothetical protein
MMIGTTQRSNWVPIYIYFKPILKVTIEDFSPTTVRNMLKFMYTNNVGEGQATTELLSASDKYDIDGLKRVCETTLGDNLTEENVVRILLVAEMHNATILREKAVDFILKRKDINQFNKEDWKELEQRAPEILTRIVKKALWEINGIVYSPAAE